MLHRHLLMWAPRPQPLPTVARAWPRYASNIAPVLASLCLACCPASRTVLLWPRRRARCVYVYLCRMHWAAGFLSRGTCSRV